MMTGTRTGRIERSVARIMAAAAVAMVVLAGTLGSTAAEEEWVYLPTAPTASAYETEYYLPSAPMDSYIPTEPTAPYIPQEPTASYIPSEPIAP